MLTTTRECVDSPLLVKQCGIAGVGRRLARAEQHRFIPRCFPCHLFISYRESRSSDDDAGGGVCEMRGALSHQRINGPNGRVGPHCTHDSLAARGGTDLKRGVRDKPVLKRAVRNKNVFLCANHGRVEGRGKYSFIGSRPRGKSGYCRDSGSVDIWSLESPFRMVALGSLQVVVPTSTVASVCAGFLHAAFTLHIHLPRWYVPNIAPHLFGRILPTTHYI